MKFIFCLFLLLLTGFASGKIDECTIKQLNYEKNCPVISSLCEIELFYLNNPNKLPTNLRDLKSRNKSIKRTFTKVISHRIIIKWKKKYGSIIKYINKKNIEKNSSRFTKLPNISKDIMEIKEIIEDIANKIIPILKFCKKEKVPDEQIIQFISTLFGFTAHLTSDIRECDQKLCILGFSHGTNINTEIYDSFNKYFIEAKKNPIISNFQRETIHSPNLSLKKSKSLITNVKKESIFQDPKNGLQKENELKKSKSIINIKKNNKKYVILNTTKQTKKENEKKFEIINMDKLNKQKLKPIARRQMHILNNIPLNKKGKIKLKPIQSIKLQKNNNIAIENKKNDNNQEDKQLIHKNKLLPLVKHKYVIKHDPSENISEEGKKKFIVPLKNISRKSKNTKIGTL